MFQFPSFPLPALYIQAGVTPNDGCRVSPFGYPRIKAYSAAPRGLSQPITSFIGVRRQGIHHWLFVAWYIDTQSRRIKSPLLHSEVPQRILMLVHRYAVVRELRCRSATQRSLAAEQRTSQLRRPMIDIDTVTQTAPVLQLGISV